MILVSRRAALVAVGALLCMSSLSPATAETVTACAPRQTGGPYWITADCVDPIYDEPVIDAERDVQDPVPHRRVSGHFEGTRYKFNIYLPPKSQWEGRFFHKVYPLAAIQDENASDETIAFGVESGAYTVQTNGDSGYRVDAAATKFAKKVAASYYREPSRRIYGYLYGGSGGSFQTIGAIENTVGVWDGAVPFIPGVPTSVPNNFFIRAFARLVLKDKAPRIADAVRPGGSGDPLADLDPPQRAVLQEVTELGVPLRGWDDYRYLLGLDSPDGLLGFGGAIRGIDPTYADDFWTKPGYLGTEQSPLGELVRAAKVDHLATITQVNRDAAGTPVSVVLDSVPAVHDPVGLDFTVYDGDRRLGSLTGSVDPATKLFRISGGDLSAVETGQQLRIDNRWAVALTSYHRHQVPRRAGFSAWDQFRGPDGTPIYPQRPVEVGALISSGVSGGGTHTGRITGKVIIVGNLLDVDAYPWHAAWYARQVQAALGDRYDDTFRVWYNDNADHLVGPVTGSRATRLIEYTGLLQQALRDLSAWVERGIAPPRSSQYKILNGQVQVSDPATRRGGIQPVVELTANGADHVDVVAGQRVTFRARIEVPPGTGSVVSAAWDFSGSGAYVTAPIGAPRPTVHLSTSFVFSKPGTYFAALRATAQRDPSSSFGQAQNLGRVRVVVH